MSIYDIISYNLAKTAHVFTFQNKKMLNCKKSVLIPICILGILLAGGITFLIIKLTQSNPQDSPLNNADGSWKRIYEIVYTGNEEYVRELLKNGVEINDSDDNGQTALHYSARYNQENITKLLIENGAIVNAQDHFGSTALHKSARSGFDRIAELLINNNANVELVDNHGDTPLHLAALNGSSKITELLCQKVAFVDQENLAQQTPLRVAAIYIDHAKVAEMLLKYGADVNRPDKNGRTVLHEVAKRDFIRTAEVLIENSADINAVDKNGWTPLHMVAEYGRVKKIAELLLKNHANVDALNKDDNTALQIAENRGHVEIADLIRTPPSSNMNIFWDLLNKLNGN